MIENIKKKTKIFLGVIIILVSASGVVYVMSNSNPQKKLEKRLETVGRDFYENMYYDHIVSNKSDEEVKEFFSKFTEIGIKVDLDNLNRYDTEKYPNLIDEFVHNKSKDACHPINTKVIIYPSEPFNKTDYTIESELDCGFEE